MIKSAPILLIGICSTDKVKAFDPWANIGYILTSDCKL